jgi:hypothetical protein
VVGSGKGAIQANLTKLRKIAFFAISQMRQRCNCMCVAAVHIGVHYQELDIAGWQANVQM